MVVPEGDYFGAMAKFAGNVKKVEIEGGEMYAMMKLTGLHQRSCCGW